MPTVELSMIVRDGEATLGRCLGSAAGVADEIVIGDTGSTDRSVEIAQRFGARIVQVPWEDDFSRARNAALRHGHSDWILYLDSDEMLDAEGARSIRPLLSNRDVFGYEVRIWTYVPSLTNRLWDQPARPNPHRLPAARLYPAYVEHKNVRLFRRHPQIAFEKRVHEGVADLLRRKGLKIAAGGFVVHHFGIVEDDEKVRRRKNLLYRSLGLEKVRETPENPLAHFELGVGELENFHNPGEALLYFERVIELTPRAHLAWTFAGICLIRLGRSKEGLERLEHARQLGGGGPVLWEAQGDAFYHLGNIDEASRCYRKAQEQGGQSALLESKLGVCEVRLGNKAGGLRLVRHAVEREPGFGELYDIWMATALWLGDLRLAAAAAEQRLKVGAPKPENFLQAAALSARLQDWRRTTDILRAGCERFPGSAELQSSIAEILTRPAPSATTGRH